jgi:hypothetical protein
MSSCFTPFLNDCDAFRGRAFASVWSGVTRMTESNGMPDNQILSPRIFSGRFKSTFFPLFDVYSSNHQPQGE